MYEHEYKYKAKVIEVVLLDKKVYIRFDIDLGFNVRTHQLIGLAGRENKKGVLPSTILQSVGDSAKSFIEIVTSVPSEIVYIEPVVVLKDSELEILTAVWYTPVGPQLKRVNLNDELVKRRKAVKVLFDKYRGD